MQSKSTTWWNPFTWRNSKDTIEESDTGDKDVGVEVLVTGGEFWGFTAGADLEARQAVKYTGNYEVGPCDDITEMYGVAMYDVVEGEEGTIVERPVVLRLNVEGDVEPGCGVGLEDSTTWVRDDDYKGYAIVHAVYEDEPAEVELRPR